MRSGYPLFSVGLVAIAAVAYHANSAAAEGPVVAQDLMNVRASTRIAAALWTRRQDSYTLQIAFPSSSHTDCMAARVTPAPPPATGPQPDAVVRSTVEERSSFFIGNTIASLRDLDPCFGARTLTLVDGRRIVPATSPPDSSPTVRQAELQRTVAAPPKGPPAIQVWLLRADGTHISPVSVEMEQSFAYGCRKNCPVSGKQYRFQLLDGAEAAAVAISVDDVYYIEKLQSLESTSR